MALLVFRPYSRKNGRVVWMPQHSPVLTTLGILRMPSCLKAPTIESRFSSSLLLLLSAHLIPSLLLQNDEDQRELGGLRQEVARAEKTCQELEDKNQVTNLHQSCHHRPEMLLQMITTLLVVPEFTN